MTSRIAALSPARSSRNGLFMIPLLILSVPFLRSVSPQAPEPVTVPAIFEEATDAARLSWILASIREIRRTVERSAAGKIQAYLALPFTHKSPASVGVAQSAWRNVSVNVSPLPRCTGESNCVFCQVARA